MASGNVWKTENNGVTFTPLFTEEAVHSLGAVAVHQVDTSLVWVGSGERASRQSSSTMQADVVTSCRQEGGWTM